MVRQFGMDQARVLLCPAGAADSKYTRGVVGMLTGSEQYPGAALLGVEGAARAGAGYVRYVGPRRCQEAILVRRPETVFSLGACDAWVIGSGMAGISEDDPRSETAMKLLDPSAPAVHSRHEGAAFCVVDAGALLTFAALEKRTGDQAHERFVVTPHSGELAQILRASGYEVTHSDIDASEASRLEWAQRARDVLGCTVVLKGAKTLVVPIDREAMELVAPMHWLATAGTGDVLAGVMGTMIAQHAQELLGERSGDGDVSDGVGSGTGSDGGDAVTDIASVAALAVYLHGLAGAVASGMVEQGGAQNAGVDAGADARAESEGNRRYRGYPLVAGDVAEALPAAISLILNGTASNGSAELRKARFRA